MYITIRPGQLSMLSCSVAMVRFEKLTEESDCTLDITEAARLGLLNMNGRLDCHVIYA